MSFSADKFNVMNLEGKKKFLSKPDKMLTDFRKQNLESLLTVCEIAGSVNTCSQKKSLALSGKVLRKR